MRFSHLFVFGIHVEWEEQPFEWVKPVRFGIERVYSKGPMARLRVRAELNEKPDGGTHLTYELWATPRNVIGMVAIPSQVKFVVEPRFRTAIKEYDESAVASTGAVGPEADTSLSSFDLSRLQALHRKLIDSIADTDLVEQKRLLQADGQLIGQFTGQFDMPGLKGSSTGAPQIQ